MSRTSLLAPERFFVVIPCHNCAEFIGQCLDSLLAQSFTGWTALVADDASDDGTEKAVSPFLRDQRITYRRLPQRAYLMGNTLDALRGLDLRPSDVVAILDGDDWIEPECLERLWERHRAGYDLVYADDVVQENGHSVGWPFIVTAPPRAQAWCFSHPRSFKGYLFNLLTDEIFRDRDGNYFRSAGDLSLILPMAELAGPEKIAFVDEPLYHYRVHDRCNFVTRREEQMRNNVDIRSRPSLMRQNVFFDFEETVVNLEKSGIRDFARKLRQRYPQPRTVCIRHLISPRDMDSWRAYHGLWVEEGVYLSANIDGGTEKPIPNRASFPTLMDEARQELKARMEAMPSRYLSIARMRREGVPFAEVLIFGAGVRGAGIRNYFAGTGIKVLGFIDNSPQKQGTIFHGLEVLSLEQANERHPRAPVYVASHWYNDISKQLTSAGRHEFYCSPRSSFYFSPNILNSYGKAMARAFRLMSDDQSRDIFASVARSYIDGDDGCLRISPYPQYQHPLVKPEDGDVIVDAGAFNGDTLQLFLSAAVCDSVVCMEPSPDTFSLLSKYVKTLGPENTTQIYCIKKGLWFKEDKLSFSIENSPGGNRIADNSFQKIQVTSLDIIFEEIGLSKLDLLKMDIEGAERQALIGAKSVLLHYKPKLQISIYHKIQDLWEIALLIDELVPGYAMYMGHHSPDAHETVLYAVYKW